jgi:two-component system, NarL family, invasion response regulator UvrY
MIKVLVADDHAVVRRGLRQILNETQDILVGGEAATAPDAMNLVRTQRWDVVILDVSIPGGNGIELISEIRREKPGTRVLILTMYSEEQYAIRAIKSGASGFLTKESAPDQLVDAVRNIASGGRYVSAELAEKLAVLVAGEASENPHEKLTDREFEVFKMLASGRTVSEIARDLSLSVKTVSTHRTRLLQKMNMRTNAELMRYAMRCGLVS